MTKNKTTSGVWKQTKCFGSSESTCSLSSEMSISYQPIQKRSTCMIQVSKDLSMTIHDFHEKLIILLKAFDIILLLKDMDILK